MNVDGKVILVLVDGLKYATAVDVMGYLEACVANGSARRWKMRCELPSLSRPLYETVHTGLAPMDHGILTNATVRLSHCDNIFSLARKANRTTAAVAFSWFSELYCKVPYDPVMGREVDDENCAIQHGRYYVEEDFPDAETIWSADMLVQRFSPDYLLVHPMGCDYAGHGHGGASSEYKRRASNMGSLLASYVPGWLTRGYTVIVTSDHGMDDQGSHGGTLDCVTAVPFYLLGAGFGAGFGGVVDAEVSQLSVAPTVLTLMGIAPPQAMQGKSLLG